MLLPARVPLVVLLALVLASGTAAQPSVGSPAFQQSPQEIRVVIRARQFEPDRILLRVGQPTHLVLHNADAELHAFVPRDLFEGLPLTIGGNGAPEFTATGFKRVIIPSEGQAEFRFTPERPGTYPFSCDMPGHEMSGELVIEPPAP